MSIRQVAQHIPGLASRKPAAPLESATPVDGYQKSDALQAGLLRRTYNKMLASAGHDDPEITMAPLLNQINDLEPTMRAMSDDDLRGQTDTFKARLAQGESMDSLLPEAFATVREAARRSTGMRPFDVQVMGGIVMYRGDIAEMGTGEGKTLAATMPAYLRALAGRGSYVLTVNDMLAQRDAQNMGRIYGALGLTTSPVTDDMSPEQKRQAYASDVTYLTNTRLAFDYLNDNKTTDGSQGVQREPCSVLVDEVDEILLDQARTPFILSGPAPAQSTPYPLYSQVMRALIPGRDYELDEAKQTVSPTDEGYDRIEQLAALLQGLSPQRDFVIDDPYRVGLTDAGLKKVQQRMAEAPLQSGTDYSSDAVHLVTDAGLQAVGQRLGTDMFAPCDGPRLLADVQQQQAQGRPVNVRFGTRDEAQPFMDLLTEQGAKFQTGQPDANLRQPIDTVGVLFPEAHNQAPGHGPHCTPRVLDSQDYSFGSIIATSDACLKAQTLYQRDRDYIVVERPEWTALRDRQQALAALPNPTEDDQQQLASVQRQHRLERVEAGLSPEEQQAMAKTLQASVVNLAERVVMGDPEGLKTSAGQILQMWASNLPESARQPGQQLDLPAWVVQPIWQAQRLALLEGVESTLPAERRQALAAQSKGPLGVDPQGSIELIDHYTGEGTPDRRFSDGIHEALEAKEGVRVQASTQTLASITMRNLLQRFEHLGGMTGTAKSDEKEFQHLCGMSVTHIRPNLPSQRVDRPDAVFATVADKEAWLLDQLEDAYRRGQPVLLGDPNIEKCHELAQQAGARGIPCEVLTPADVQKNSPEQAAIIAAAGRSGHVTIANDQAGRGVDIKTDLVSYKALGDAAVQRSQQGAAVAIPVADAAEADRVREWLGQVPSTVAKSGTAAAQPGTVTLLYPGAAAPNAAVLNPADYPTGGLLVLGAERHDAHRIDNQLIGRAGRQGAPGVTQFAVSAEDSLVQNFAGEPMEHWLSRHGEEHSADGVAARLLEKAQQQAQDLYASSRQNNARYEEPQNIQRQIVYNDRQQVLDGFNLSPQMVKWADRKVHELAEPYRRNWGSLSDDDAQVLADSVHDFFGLPDHSVQGQKWSKTTEALKAEVHEAYAQHQASDPGLAASTRDAFITALDDEWHQHLDDMADLQQGIGYRAVAQTDPVVAFKREAFQSFGDMKERVEDRTLQEVFGVAPSHDPAIGVVQAWPRSLSQNLLPAAESQAPRVHEPPPNRSESGGRDRKMADGACRGPGSGPQWQF